MAAKKATGPKIDELTEQVQALPDDPPDAGGQPVPTADAPQAPAPPAPAISSEAILSALEGLPDEAVQTLLKRAGLVPTTAGMDAETLQTIIQTAGGANARAMQLALRRENPSYPERSVFNPRGKYDDDGNPQAPKLRLRRPTYYCGVRLGGELETEEEIELFNRFTETREIRAKQWKAELVHHGNEERLYVSVPCRTVDDRMMLPANLSLILLELLGGEEAVNPVSMQAQIDALKKQVEAMGGKPVNTESTPEAASAVA